MGIYNRQIEDVYIERLNELATNASNKKWVELAKDVKDATEKHKLYKASKHDDENVDINEIKGILSKDNTILSNIITYGGIGTATAGAFITFSLISPIIGGIITVIGIVMTSISVTKKSSEYSAIITEARKSVTLMKKLRDKTDKGSKEYNSLNNKIKVLEEKIDKLGGGRFDI